MHLAQCLIDGTKLTRLEILKRECFGNKLYAFIHCVLNDLAQLMLLQAFGKRVDREDFAWRRFVASHRCHPRMNELPAEALQTGLSGNEYFLATLKAVLHEGLIEPDGAEVRTILP